MELEVLFDVFGFYWVVGVQLGFCVGFEFRGVFFHGVGNGVYDTWGLNFILGVPPIYGALCYIFSILSVSVRLV